MAKLTPEEILRLSEPVEQVYSNIVDALLINIAEHFKTGKELSTQQWQIKKLSELGQLNKESAEIIARLSGQAPEMVLSALEGAVIAATADVEPELKKAAQKGVIKAASADNVTASESIRQALTAYDTQAKNKINLVNSTMLQSTQDLFKKIVANTVAIDQQIQATQQILNTAAGKVITGAESRTQALRKALMDVQKEGITGFYDRAGRKWSPEAYINMDIRTTVHNTAIEAVKLRQEDYGVSIFRVSRHSGARPLCYPYQGRYFSWDNESGTFTDGEGKRHRYSPLSSTSYGKPAGLFGINCGHHPITVIPGVSIPRDMPTENKAENDRIYAESQEQRRLEREIRYAKQKAVMLYKAGDKEGFEAEALKIKNAQAKYNAFCKETGRSKRIDRTQVFEYNKSVSSKATAAAKKAKAGKLSVKPSSSKTIENPPKTKLPDIQPQTREYRKFETGKDVNDFFYYDDEKRGLLAKKKSQYGQWAKNLPAENKTAIVDYSTDGFDDINKYWRKSGDWERIDVEKVKHQTQKIDESISTFILKDDIEVYRGIDLGVIADLFPEAEELKDLVGSVYSDQAFASTSPVLKVAKKFAEQNGTDGIILALDIPQGKGKGAYLDAISAYGESSIGADLAEYEFLLKRGAKFEIYAVDESGTIPIVKGRWVE